MKEDIALLVFFLSLLGLLLLKPQTVPLSKVEEVGKVYHSCGVFLPIKELDRGCIYRITDGNVAVKGIAFFGECVSGYSCFYGRVDVYRGEREVVVLGYG
jgi:hypothetical protein